MDEQKVKRLLRYLSKFGQVKFKPCDYSNPEQVKYARIEIITKEEVADNLIHEINEQLNEKSGIRASMRLIPLTCPENQKCKYVAEIVPYDYVPLNEKQDATNEYIHRLPHVIKNYRKKNPSPARKK
jgi:hypothetical protein